MRNTQANMQTSTWEVVGPDEARKMLESMGVNRKVVQTHVERLAEAMRKGDWIEAAGDPLRFNERGELIDGQHRLWAVIEAGVPLHFTILRGIPKEAMNVLDTGLRRALKDFLEMHGERDTAELAGALRFLSRYWATKEMTMSSWKASALTVTEALGILEEHPGIRESVVASSPVARVIGGGRARWAAIHYILTSIDGSDAEQFFRKLITGGGITTGSPIALLRNHLVVDWHSLRRMGVREYVALVFKTWNLYRRGMQVRALNWRGGGAHPEEYPMPR